MINLIKPFTLDDFPTLQEIEDNLPIFDNKIFGYDDLGWLKRDFIFYINCLRRRFLETQDMNYYKFLLLLTEGVRNYEADKDNSRD